MGDRGYEDNSRATKDILADIINRFRPKDYVGNIKDDAYKYFIKGIADKYSNSLYDEEYNIIVNFWWDTFSEDNKDLFKNSILVSKAACDSVYGTKIKDRNHLKNILDLHLEHLTPMGFTFNKVVELVDQKEEPTDIDIDDCFRFAGLALITKEESKHLDSGWLGGRVMPEDLTALEQLEKDLSIDLSSTRFEAQKLLIDGKTLKSNGDGLLRLIHLINTGSTFVDSNGRVLNTMEAAKRLINNKFKVNQYKGEK